MREARLLWETVWRFLKTPAGPVMRPRDVETLVQAEARPRALVATESRQAKGRNCPKASPACTERQNVVQENTTATDMAHGVDEPQNTVLSERSPSPKDR